MCVYEYLPKVNTADADAIDACNEYHASTHDRDQTCSTVNVTLTAETSLQWRANERDGVPNPGAFIFTRPFVQAHIKENIKVLRHWPLWRGSTGDRRIPLTRGQ